MDNITLDTITKAVVDHGDRGKSHPRVYCFLFPFLYLQIIHKILFLVKNEE